MRVQFHGAARTVTGSSTLFEAGGTRVLVDCGQFQGDPALEERNREPFGFDPASLDAVVLTHAHIDHIGRTPTLLKQGFRGPIVCTRTTSDLASVMLLDAAKIAGEDERSGGAPAPYDDRDVEQTYRRIQGLEYGRTLKLGDGVSIALSDAGHILGSAHVLLTLREGGREVVYGLSGDVGCPGRPVVPDPTPFRALDVLQIEATYGDRDHRPLRESVDALEAVLTKATEGDGVVLIPAFSLGRTQDILWLLNGWKNAGKLKGLPVYVDSPLASRVTAVFDHNKGDYDEPTKKLLAGGDDPFSFDDLHFIGDAEESERVRHEARRALIVASSGMCQSGRIRAHLETFLPRPETHVVIVGYQANGTLGRRLVEGAKTVQIGGRDVPVNAAVHTLGGFSAHAGRKELLDWVDAIEKKPRRVFLHHGEPHSLDALAQSLRERFPLETVIPSYRDSFDL